MFRIRLLVSGIVLAVALLAAALLAPQLGAAAPSAQGPQLPATITVVGSGSTTAEPERARLTIGVEAIDESVQVASDENVAAMEAVLAALEEVGVAKKDMQTANYSIWAETVPQPEAATIRYHVTNQVNVLVNDPAKVSDVLDAAIKAGATTIYGVSFEVKDTKALEGKARAAAIEDAQARAADLAALTGVEVGPVVQISEVIANTPLFREAGAGGSGPQMNPGELTFNSQVQVTFELLR